VVFVMVTSVMDAHGDTAMPIASTETGGPTTSYGESGQATIIGHDFDALDDPRLAFVLVYSMMDDVVTSQPGFGLLRPDRSHRPAWSTFKQGRRPGPSHPTRRSDLDSDSDVGTVRSTKRAEEPISCGGR